MTALRDTVETAINASFSKVRGVYNNSDGWSIKGSVLGQEHTVAGQAQRRAPETVFVSG